MNKGIFRLLRRRDRSHPESGNFDFRPIVVPANASSLSGVSHIGDSGCTTTMQRSRWMKSAARDDDQAEPDLLAESPVVGVILLLSMAFCVVMGIASVVLP